MLRKVTIPQHETMSSSTGWFRSHIAVVHFSEVCAFVEVLACSNVFLESTFVLANSYQGSKSHMVLWSANWYFLVILLTVQVAVNIHYPNFTLCTCLLSPTNLSVKTTSQVVLKSLKF